ncbi:MAG: acyl carrier protein, partial [Verrucomicrobiota bacterium]
EDFSSLDPEQNLREQLDLDSMDFLDIVMELRKQYGVEVPENEYPQLATLNSCIDYLEPKMKSA